MENYKTSAYPNSRFATFDVGVIGGKKHHVVGLLEVDVTFAKEKISAGIKAGKQIGFTAWIIKVVADTIAADKSIYAINTKKNKQIIFEDIDISAPFEKLVNGIKVPLAAVIRKADKKTLSEIHAEIQSFIKQDVKTEGEYVLGQQGNNFAQKLFFNMPQWIRLIVWRFLLRNPFSIKKNMGTVMITNVGTAGNISGWIIPKSLHNISFGIGSINKKPWVHNGNIEVRKIMHITILFDHDVVDGAPAARFTANLKKNIERAAGL